MNQAHRMDGLMRLAAVLTAVLVLPLTGCSDTDPDADPTSSSSTLPAEVPSGTMLCDFVPERSVTTILGTDEYEADGESARDTSGNLTSARCDVRKDGEQLDSIRVDANVLLGIIRPAFERGLTNDDYDQLPDAEGLGYSWTEDQNGTTIGRSRLARGDYLVEVELLPADSRDASADAMALALQVASSLDIPDEWTLDGRPPSR